MMTQMTLLVVPTRHEERVLTKMAESLPLPDKCGNCGNTQAFVVHIKRKTKEATIFCRKCGYTETR
jgi:transcription elongation factor Elf1